MNNKYIFITLLMLSTIFSQEKNHNLNFLFANNAYGLSYEYQRFVKPDLSVGADLRFYDIRTDEYPVYDPFYNQYDVSGEKSILIFPMYIRLNYFPFKDKIANNFQPFLLFSFGPFVTIDGDENAGSFSDKWSGAPTQVNLGASIGFGVTLQTDRASGFSFGIAYDHLQVEEPIHDQEDFGGGFLYLQYRLGRE